MNQTATLTLDIIERVLDPHHHFFLFSCQIGSGGGGHAFEAVGKYLLSLMRQAKVSPTQ